MWVNFPFAPLLANGFLSLKSINWSRTMESDVSVTVLILILSLFHQNIITSSAALTTTSFFVQHAVPSGLATFYALCNFQLQVQQRSLRARNYCTTLILSLFHQNAITSSAAFTTASSLYNMACPRGSQLFVPSETFNYKSSSVHNNRSFVHAVPPVLASFRSLQL